MYRLLPLLGDVGLGILSIVFVSLLYDRHELSAFLLMPLAFLPDLDALAELRVRGKLAASAEHPYDHREVLHKPIIWLVLLGLVWWSVGYYGAVAFVMVLVHFLHDSVLTGWGVPWFAPLSDIRIKFFVDEQNEISIKPRDWVRTWNKQELRRAIVMYGNENWVEDLYLNPTVVSSIEYGVFILSLVAIVVVF